MYYIYVRYLETLSTPLYLVQLKTGTGIYAYIYTVHTAL